MKQKVIEMQGEIDKSPVVVRDFYSLFKIIIKQVNRN